MRTSFGIGMLIGLLLAAPLVSLLYLAHTALGAPFIPFDMFDGMVRILPGSVVSFGIDSMVRVLMFFGLSLSASAKIAEQIQAIVIFLCACAFAAGVFFAALRDRSSRAVVPLGLVLGIAIALPITALAGHPVWTLAALTIWALAVSAARKRVVGRNPVTRTAPGLSPLS